jgi:hypothetical protein
LKRSRFGKKAHRKTLIINAEATFGADITSRLAFFEKIKLLTDGKLDLARESGSHIYRGRIYI